MKRLIKKIWRYMKWIEAEKIRLALRSNSADNLR